jgi:hypothetical protein
MNEATAGSASLIVLSGSDQGKRFVLAQTPLIIGSGESCEIFMKADGVAARHAVIDREREELMLTGLGSAPVIFNGRELKAGETAVLTRGNTIEVGRVLLRFIAPGEVFTLAEGAADRLIDRKPGKLQTFVERAAVAAAAVCIVLLVTLALINRRELEAQQRTATADLKVKQKQLAFLLEHGDEFFRSGKLSKPQCGETTECVALDRCSNAEECFEKALRVDPDDSYVKARVAEIAAVKTAVTAGGKGSAEVEELLAQATEAYEAGRLIYPANNNARELYQQVLVLDPKNEEAARKLGQIEVQLDRIEAEKERLLAQAQAYRDKGQFVLPTEENALDTLEKVFVADPKNAKAEEMLWDMAANAVVQGNLYRSRADAENMLKWYQTAEALGVDSAYLEPLKRGADLMRQSKAAVMVLKVGDSPRDRGRDQVPSGSLLDTSEIKKRVAKIELQRGIPEEKGSRVFIDRGENRYGGK